MAQMAQYYELPFFGTAGATDAKCCDPQAAAEATFQCLSAAAIGSGLVHDCSSWMDHGALVSPAYMVLVNEILHNVNQFMNGVPVTDDTLAIDLIDRVGPGGHFLQEDHTMNHFRKVRYSKLFDRTVYDQWREAGSKRFEERLREITRETMDHQPAPLASEITRELDRMQSHWK
jgi:trimethylamine--corrinoid protein Co-methyltransferase